MAFAETSQSVTPQDRQQALIDAFAEQHPDLAEAVEMFGVAEDLYTQAASAAAPATNVSNNTTVRS